MGINHIPSKSIDYGTLVRESDSELAGFLNLYSTTSLNMPISKIKLICRNIFESVL